MLAELVRDHLPFRPLLDETARRLFFWRQRQQHAIPLGIRVSRVDARYPLAQARKLFIQIQHLSASPFLCQYTRSGYDGGFMPRLPLLVLSISAALSAFAADKTDKFDIPAHYTKFEYRIPMRDGVRLFTQVYVPKGHIGKLSNSLDPNSLRDRPVWSR